MTFLKAIWLIVIIVVKGELNECSSKPEFASLKLRRHLVLVYKIHSKTHGILPIKSRFLAIWGCFLQFLKNLSRNLPILCAHLEERPQLWGCLFYNFYSYLEPFGYNGQLNILKFDSGHPSWSGNPENTFTQKDDPHLGGGSVLWHLFISRTVWP